MRESIKMKLQTATATKIIPAPAQTVYAIIADYRTKHPLILPQPYFQSVDVEEGGVGAGTIINFRIRILGQTQAFHSLISEPEPGRVLLETDLNSGVSTRFEVSPLEHQGRTQVKISTELKSRGAVEGYMARLLLQKIYRQELELLSNLAEDQTALVKPAPSSRVP